MGGEGTSARGSGKAILLGEHAVVYGYPAIAVALARGASASAEREGVTSLELGGQRLLVARAAEPLEPPQARAFRALLEALPVWNVAARAELEIPAGAGLGASAALGVALARAVAALVPAPGGGEAHASRHDPRVARAALAWEQVFHGNASGLDTAAAELGGCIWFTRKDGPTPLGVARAPEVLVALAEPGQSTRLMVEGVRARREAEPGRMDAALSAIAELAERGRKALLAGQLAELGSVMNENHALLAELGVSTAGLERAVECARRAGALGAKLTGAGGGGSVVALVDRASRGAVLEAWRAQGFPVWEPAPLAGSHG